MLSQMQMLKARELEVFGGKWLDHADDAPKRAKGIASARLRSETVKSVAEP